MAGVDWLVYFWVRIVVSFFSFCFSFFFFFLLFFWSLLILMVTNNHNKNMNHNNLEGTNIKTRRTFIEIYVVVVVVVFIFFVFIFGLFIFAVFAQPRKIQFLRTFGVGPFFFFFGSNQRERYFSMEHGRWKVARRSLHQLPQPPPETFDDDNPQPPKINWSP